MRLRHLLFAFAVTAFPTGASANHFTEIWNGTSGTITVRDNGVTVCQTPPLGMCGWDMADGFHRVEVTGFNGVSLSMEGTVPNNSFMSAFQDCDFTGAECPEEEW
jgi:hypothetical protein